MPARKALGKQDEVAFSWSLVPSVKDEPHQWPALALATCSAFFGNGSSAWWRKKLKAVSLPNLNNAWDLLLLRTQRTNFF